MFIPQTRAAWRSLWRDRAKHLPAVGYSGLAALLLTQIPATQAFILDQDGAVNILLTLVIWTVLLAATRAFEWLGHKGDGPNASMLDAFALSGLAALALTAMPVMAVTSLQQDLLSAVERPWLKSVGPMAVLVFCAVWASLLCAIWFTQRSAED